MAAGGRTAKDPTEADFEAKLSEYAGHLDFLHRIFPLAKGTLAGLNPLIEVARSKQRALQRDVAAGAFAMYGASATKAIGREYTRILEWLDSELRNLLATSVAGNAHASIDVTAPRIVRPPPKIIYDIPPGTVLLRHA